MLQNGFSQITSRHKKVYSTKKVLKYGTCKEEKHCHTVNTVGKKPIFHLNVNIAEEYFVQSTDFQKNMNAQD